MKLFLDTEFTGFVKNTTLISIGLVADNGNTFYAEFSDFDSKLVDDWVRENVIPNLRFDTDYSSTPKIDYRSHAMKSDKYIVSTTLLGWLSQFDKVEIWSDCLAYDWVLFCDLFGGALNIPTNIYYIPFDISTMFLLKGIDPDTPRYEYVEMNGKIHNSLEDALVIRACYEKLKGTT